MAEAVGVVPKPGAATARPRSPARTALPRKPVSWSWRCTCGACWRCAARVATQEFDRATQQSALGDIARVEFKLERIRAQLSVVGSCHAKAAGPIEIGSGRALDDP